MPNSNKRTKDVLSAVISSAEAAALLGVKQTTLRNWRVQGKGPDYIRQGRKRSPVLYYIRDIESWLERNHVSAKARR